MTSTPDAPVAEREYAARMANAVRAVAAILSSERVQGWANPLVLDLVEASDLLDRLGEEEKVSAKNPDVVLSATPPSQAQDGWQLNEAAIEAATKFIYENKGDRKGILYVGWDAETEEVRQSWRNDVRPTIEAYLRALPAPPSPESKL